MGYSYEINDYYQEQFIAEDEEAKSFRYYVMSTILHILFAVLATYVGSLVSIPLLPPVTEFTIVEAKTSSPAPQAEAPTVGPKMMPAAPIPQARKIEPKETITKDDVVIKKQVKPKAAQAKPQKASKPVTKVAKANRVIVGPTIKDSDLIAPILETEDFENELKSELKVKAKDFDERFIADDLAKIDKENEVKVAHLRKELVAATSELEQEQEQDLQYLSSEQKALNDAMIAQANRLKAESQSKIAAVRSGEAAQAQAQALAEAQARAKASRTRDGREFGVSGPVRALEDIRQMPGNKKPQYDSEDRLARRQGEISFIAYVSSQGKITQFKLIKGTGHRSLDGKTLMAIKEWKFYPGQEGWVEIPFKWDLKGGAQEMPATLRRR